MYKDGPMGPGYWLLFWPKIGTKYHTRQHMAGTEEIWTLDEIEK
jgi:hypothetical protein